MKNHLLLWLFLPVVLSASEPDDYANGTAETLDIYEDYSLWDDTAINRTPDYSHLIMDDHDILVFSRDPRGIMTAVASECIPDDEFIIENFKFLNYTGGFLVRNITCILTTELSCSWDVHNAPLDAEYSASIIQRGKPSTVSDCDITEGTAIGCHGNIKTKEEAVILRINVSCENFWYIHARIFDPKDIVKLNPPKNVSASLISGSLQIAWVPPIQIRDKCLRYQLRINKEDEQRDIYGQKNCTVHNVDPTKDYFVQLRVTKTRNCRENNIWSDWSTTVEVHGSKTLLNPVMIASIVLGIPMFLLAVFLVCRCHREIDKLFPVPSPSMKIKQLLERDDFIQVSPMKCVEEVTEILFVGNDSSAKIPG